MSPEGDIGPVGGLQDPCGRCIILRGGCMILGGVA